MHFAQVRGMRGFGSALHADVWDPFFAQVRETVRTLEMPSDGRRAGLREIEGVRGFSGFETAQVCPV